MFEKYLQYFVIKGIIFYMDKKQLTITLSIIGGVLVLILVVALIIHGCNKKNDVLVPTETTTSSETTTEATTTESETEPSVTTDEGEVIVRPDGDTTTTTTTAATDSGSGSGSGSGSATNTPKPTATATPTPKPDAPTTAPTSSTDNGVIELPFVPADEL